MNTKNNNAAQNDVMGMLVAQQAQLRVLQAAKEQQLAVKQSAEETMEMALDNDSGSEVGVEDEVSYVVAEGTATSELTGASGLFGGALAPLAGAAAGLGPLAAGAAGLAALAALAGGSDEDAPATTGGPVDDNDDDTGDDNTGDDDNNDDDDDTGGEPGSDPTGVVGALDAISDGISGNIPGVGEPVGGVVLTVAEGVQAGGDALTPNLPGPLGPGGDALVGDLMAETSPNGTLVEGEQNYGLIGALQAGGGGAANEALIPVRDGIAGFDASALPGGTNVQEALLDIVGASTESPRPAAAAGDLPVDLGLSTSAITSAVDSLSANLPLPTVL